MKKIYRVNAKIYDDGSVKCNLYIQELSANGRKPKSTYTSKKYYDEYCDYFLSEEAAVKFMNAYFE